MFVLFFKFHFVNCGTQTLYKDLSSEVQSGLQVSPNGKAEHQFGFSGVRDFSC